MCGIAGIFQFNHQPVDPAEILAITNAMPHRGPDAGSWMAEEEIALGHRRLSIIDLSSAANQPFSDASGRYTIVFNGEMYNYMEVRALLPEYEFQTSGDTEVLIAAFAKWGTACISYFKGMFAFAVWDRQKRQLTLMRDRLGVKPLYYYADDKQFIFASEIRAILASGKIKRKINKQALVELFSYQSIGQALSPIENIQQMGAGTCLQVKAGKLSTQVYWDITQQRNTTVDFNDVALVKQKYTIC
jgi:asparagine synthase (glutamine-hydrolysing)